MSGQPGSLAKRYLSKSRRTQGRSAFPARAPSTCSSCTLPPFLLPTPSLVAQHSIDSLTQQHFLLDFLILHSDASPSTHSSSLRLRCLHRQEPPQQRQQQADPKSERHLTSSSPSPPNPPLCLALPCLAWLYLLRRDSGLPTTTTVRPAHPLGSPPVPTSYSSRLPSPDFRVQTKIPRGRLRCATRCTTSASAPALVATFGVLSRCSLISTVESVQPKKLTWLLLVSFCWWWWQSS